MSLQHVGLSRFVWAQHALRFVSLHLLYTKLKRDFMISPGMTRRTEGAGCKQLSRVN
jgi:hypothetical protein